LGLRQLSCPHTVRKGYTLLNMVPIVTLIQHRSTKWTWHQVEMVLKPVIKKLDEGPTLDRNLVYKVSVH